MGMTEEEQSRVFKIPSKGLGSASTSTITQYLTTGHQTGDFIPLVDYLKTLTPARADLEIRSLDPRARNGFSELATFVMALTNRLVSKKDFELVNAWMTVFLKIHADTVALSSQREEPEYQSLRKALASWSHEQRQEGKRLTELVGYCRGVAGFLRSSR